MRWYLERWTLAATLREQVYIDRAVLVPEFRNLSKISIQDETSFYDSQAIKYLFTARQQGDVVVCMITRRHNPSLVRGHFFQILQVQIPQVLGPRTGAPTRQPASTQPASPVAIVGVFRGRSRVQRGGDSSVVIGLRNSAGWRVCRAASGTRRRGWGGRAL